MSGTSTIEGDYTRGGLGPVGRGGWGPVALLTERMIARRALVILVATLVGVLGLLPFDGMVAAAAVNLQPGHKWAMGGDLKRELEFVQQFGDVVCVLIVFAAIFLLDPKTRRRLWDGATALVATAAAYEVLKIGIGRPRPRFNDPWHFCGFWGSYEIKPGVWRHSWEFWGGISSDLWSMPSSHTAAGTALAVVLARLYPRVGPLVAVLAVVVGVCRVLVGAHYPSDVWVGWGMGVLVAGWGMDCGIGGRAARAVLGPKA